MERNVELIERTMQHIQDEPESWDQQSWIGENLCGTTACFAGRALMLSGSTAFEVTRMTHEYDEDRDMLMVRSEAARRLGLSRDEALTLFQGGNGRRELELMVKDLVNGDELRNQGDYLQEAEE
jgi:hypothetical protein